MKISWVSIAPILVLVINQLLQVFPAGSKGAAVLGAILLVVQAFLPRVVKPAGTP